jgi:hypothetical protein
MVILFIYMMVSFYILYSTVALINDDAVLKDGAVALINDDYLTDGAVILI